MAVEQPEQRVWPDHPVVCTFATTLPFPLGLIDGGVHLYHLTAGFEDVESAALFPSGPYVRLRVNNAQLGGLQFEPATTVSALRSFYGKEVEGAAAGLIPGEAYEQWVSLETPSPRLAGEDPDDAAYPFHRCLRILDLFLRAHNLAFKSAQVYPLSTEEIGHVVFVGQYELDGDWSFAFPVLVQPGRVPDYRQHRPNEREEKRVLGWAFEQIEHAHPFITAVIYALRAQRAERFHGDRVDQVISLQTAMESRLFSTWAMLLVDEGKTGGEIVRTLSADTPFKSLVVRILPGFLGGRWDIGARRTPVGAYWQDLYVLRNRVVHAGLEPSPRQANEAQQAYDGLRHFIRERLWARRRRFPRAAVTVIGQDGMAAQGWHDAAYAKQINEMERELRPYFLPWDTAGRPKLV